MDAEADNFVILPSFIPRLNSPAKENMADKNQGDIPECQLTDAKQ